MFEGYELGFNETELVIELVEQLQELVGNGLEFSDEYWSLIEEIKDAINSENDAYDMLSLVETDRFIDNFVKSGVDYEDEPVLERYYRILDEKMKIMMIPEYVKDGIYRDTLIDAKVLVDTLKKINEHVLSVGFSNGNEEKFYKDLLAYHEQIKYSFLFSNSYLERFCLDNSFKISELPDIDLDGISCDELSEVLEINARGLITLMLSLESNEYEVDHTYALLYNILQLEVYMDIIDDEHIKKLYDYFIKIRAFDLCNSLLTGNNIDNNGFLKNSIYKVLKKRRNK